MWKGLFISPFPVIGEDDYFVISFDIIVMIWIINRAEFDVLVIVFLEYRM